METLLIEPSLVSKTTSDTLANCLPEISVGTTYFRQHYLFAFATQGELLHHIRTQTLQEEVDRLEEIHSLWLDKQGAVQMLAHTESGIAERCSMTELPSSLSRRVNEISSHQLIRKTFQGVPFSFSLVDTDRLIAAQRCINLDYALRLQNAYKEDTSLEALVEICLSPNRYVPPIQHLEVGNNVHVFSSENLDIRFLGAFAKTLTPEDLQFAELGGMPAAAIIAFIGYGSSPVNVLQVGNRLVLNNGFHRVFALRSLGVTKIPVLVQHISNWQLEFPGSVAGLPREYLLGSPRPVLIKDFHNDNFCVTLRAKQRIKSVMLQLAASQIDIPS
jgi:hypothetical protein